MKLFITKIKFLFDKIWNEFHKLYLKIFCELEYL